MEASKNQENAPRNAPPGKGEVPPTPSIPVIVGLGASAGGLEVLKQLFAILPNDTGLAFLVVMHLEPSRKSMLDQLLARETAMPVCMAEEGLTAAPNQVYICPPQQELTLRDGRLHLAESPPAGRYRPIDAVFRSLAGLGEQAIAVVLSGAGKDGAEGIKAVKAAGGTVLAQAEQTAAFPDMPRNAVATGMVDQVLAPEDIARALMEMALLFAPAALAPGHPEVAGNLRTILHLLRAKTGHDFSAYKENMIVRRIERRLAATGSTDFASYAACLANDPTEAQTLSQDLLIGVTSFFRDPEAFAALHDEIFPSLFAGRGPDEPVRIWHASCSSGEEAYSMAILVREFLVGNNLVAPIKMFATDIDETAIAQARRGVYPAAIADDLSPQRLQEFFIRSDTGYQVVKALREMIVFAPHSLIKDPPFSHLDLLVCRNFLIYLKPDMQRQLFTLFHLALKPGGFLFLGVSETIRPASNLFELVDKRWKIYRRLAGERRPVTAFPFFSSVARYATPNLSMRLSNETPPATGSVEKLLIERYVPPSVVVNEQYEVVHFPTGRTSRFLEAPVGEPTRDLLKLTRPELRSILRTAIHKSFADKSEVVFRGLAVAGEPPLTVNIRVEPLPEGRLALVQFETVSEAPPALPADGTARELPADDISKEGMILQLEEQLQITQEQLQATIEQLETSNEGLMSSNEELISINEEFQSTNEELHSTNEELETSREELQALNEELINVNTELQQKVEELNQANNDMDNLLTSSEIATIFLDRELRIKRFTPAMAKLFHLIPADCQRPFKHLAGIIDWPEFDREMAQVLAGELPSEHEVATHHGGRCFLSRALPYRTTAGHIDGVVVTLIDITERKRLEEKTRHLASFPEVNPNPVIELDLTGTIRYFNPAIANILKDCGEDAEDATPFLPPDLQGLVRAWDQKTEATHTREVSIGDRSFAATVHLVPEPGVVRVYAYDVTDRKRAEEFVLESRERLQLFIEHAPAALAMFDRDMRYLFVSRRWRADYGLGDADLTGKSHYEIFPEIPERWKQAHRLGLEGQVLRAEADSFDRFDDSVQWLQWEVRPWFRAAGEVGGIVIFTEDITERFRSEQRLQLLATAASELLRTEAPQALVDRLCREVMDILDCQAFFNFLVDEDSGRLHLNACAGIPEDERRRIEWLDYGVAVCGCAARDACRIVAEDIAQTTDPRTELVKSYGIQSYACHPLMVQGRVLGTLSFGSRTRPRFSDDELALMAAVADHVAIAMERKLTEESLQEREELYRAIVSSAGDGIVLIDPETLRMVEFNDAACASLGYSREEFATLSLADLHPDESEEEMAHRLEAGKLGDRNLDHFHRHKSGELRLVQVSSRHVTIKGKIFLASVWHDVTDRKRTEAEREKVDRLESLGVLAGGIAHDFNNILTAITGNISLARLKAGGGHPALAPLAASQKALQRATDLTRQLLTFSRGGEPAKKPLETGQLLDEILSFALHGSNCRGKLDLTDGLWPMYADPGQVHQALNNLIINAIQSMPGGGSVCLAAANAAVAEGQIPDLQPGRYLQISLSDQGCGIPAANLVKIFDPYFTTKPAGTGLGLASTFSIVKRHGGAIEVSSQPEQGTVFTLWLPAADGPLPPRTDTPERQEGLPLAQPGMAILVMDDEEMIRSLAGAMLEELGYKTVLCADGSQAVAAYSEALERGESFSAVILDMTVPGGMGGKETALKIHTLDPAAVLVISTGYSVDSTLDGTMGPLFKGAVAKPYSLGRLARELARVTGGRGD